MAPAVDVMLSDTVYCMSHGLSLVEGIKENGHRDGRAYVTGWLACGCATSFVGSAEQWPELRRAAGYSTRRPESV